MAVSAKWYGLGLKHALTDVNLDSDTIYAMILTSSYTLNQDTDEFLDDINTNEVTGTGYTAGGQDVTSLVSVDYTSGTNTVAMKLSDDVTWASSTITGRYLAFYKHTGTAGTSALLGYQDAGTDIVSSGGDWTFTPDAGGILESVAS